MVVYDEKVCWTSTNLSNASLEKAAKEALISILKKKYKEISFNGRPSDLKAIDESGKVFFYELKATRKERYFGSASFSEWELALDNKDKYFFIVAYYNEATKQFTFSEYTPAEFMKFSTIPPFKVYFNLSAKTGQSLVSSKTKALRLEKENFDTLNKVYSDLKKYKIK